MPKAYLGVLFFDERLNFIAESSSLIRVSQQGDGATPLVLGNIRAPRNGYAYVYVSNESNEPVFFDDLKVQHRRSALLEETHYYPFGLTMAGISGKALNNLLSENKKKYQQYEFNDDLEVNLYESFYRTHDPQIGRFLQIDPKPNDLESLFAAMSNNPIKNVDILGDTASPIVTAFNTVARHMPGAISLPNNKIGEVMLGTMLGMGEAGRDAVVGLYNTFRHPLQTLDGVSQMTTAQGQVNFGLDIASNYIQSKNELGSTVTNSRYISYGLTTLGIALAGPKALKGTNQFVAETYLGATGKSGSFASVEGFSLRLGAKDFVYHNSYSAAKNTPWSSPVSFSSSSQAFNGLALGYKGTTNFAQMKFSISNIGLFVKGTASAQGVTMGGATQLLRTPLSVGVNVKKLGFSF